MSASFSTTSSGVILSLTSWEATVDCLPFSVKRTAWEHQVAEMLQLTPAEIEDHFAGNAQRFLALMRREVG